MAADVAAYIDSDLSASTIQAASVGASARARMQSAIRDAGLAESEDVNALAPVLLNGLASAAEDVTSTAAANIIVRGTAGIIHASNATERRENLETGPGLAGEVAAAGRYTTWPAQSRLTPIPTQRPSDRPYVRLPARS